MWCTNVCIWMFHALRVGYCKILLPSNRMQKKKKKCFFNLYTLMHRNGSSSDVTSGFFRTLAELTRSLRILDNFFLISFTFLFHISILMMRIRRSYLELHVYNIVVPIYKKTQVQCIRIVHMWNVFQNSLASIRNSSNSIIR